MVHSEVYDTKLVDKDDYDVRLDDGSGPVVGRIMRHPQATELLRLRRVLQGKVERQ
jgi:hypothetical protein